ncbi:MAG: DUF4416 family protein [Aquificota bacterium]|nr:MAG: DUF4416 family protein [Aquificota bacterium]
MKKALLLFALMWNVDKEENLKHVEKILEKTFGKKILETEPFSLEYSSYYQKEMGERLLKKFVAFDCFVEKNSLIDLKHFSMKLEDKFRENGGRTVNIDPIYLDEYQVVVTSSKDKGSRIYLGKGVYAELELLYHHGSFQPLIWTYLDYKNHTDFFNRVRKYYLRYV